MYLRSSLQCIDNNDVLLLSSTGAFDVRFACQCHYSTYYVRAYNMEKFLVDFTNSMIDENNNC